MTGGVLEEFSGAIASARATLAGFLELVTLEARRAGLALVWMVAGGLVAALCFAGAWLGLMAALAMWVVSLGVPPIAAAIGFALANLLGGAAMIYACIRISRDLMFSATRRQLAGKPAAEPASP